MDLFRRLVETLEQTVDYISTFAAYLLGDEAHPGAETVESRRDSVPQGSHRECNVETAHDGDISPRDNLEAFKGPPIAEIIPPSQELQEVSGKAFTCAEDTEAILGLSRSPGKDEGQEDVSQKLSEAPDFVADAPKPISTATGNIQQRDLEEPTVAGGFHQWEAEGSRGMETVQQELLVEMADVEDWKPETPLDGGRASLSVSGEAEGTQQREQEGDEADDQEVPGGAQSEKEEQRGLDQAAQTGGFQHEVAKIMEDQQSEADGRVLGGAKMEDDQQEEPYIEARDEVTQPDGAVTGGDQQGEEVARSNLQWESEETVYLEEQEEDVERVSEKEDCQRRGLDGSETEEPQQGELEGFVRNEGDQQRGQVEQEAEATGGEESVVEEKKELLRVAWTGGLQQEVAKMAEEQWLETEGQLAGQAGAENDQKREMEIEAGDEGVQEAMPDRGHQQRGQEGEAGRGRDLQWEPEETVTSEEHPDKGNGQQQGPEGAGDGGGYQRGELEELLRSGVESEEEGQEEQVGKAWLEKDQQTDPETLAGITVLEKAEAAVLEEPEVQGQEPQKPEGTERNLPHEPLGHNAPLDTCRLAGDGPFPDEAPFLNTSAQKERVLLRRKSSIRRAPSLKRPRPPTETPLETDIAENSPSQPPAPSRPNRPNRRPPGFGPMPPNVMAELQVRLRRPQ